MIGGINKWFNSKRGQTFNYDGAGVGTRRCSFGHYDPSTKVMQFKVRGKSAEPVDYRLSSRKFKTSVRALLGNPKKYISTLDECYCKKGFNYLFEFFYITDKLPSEETMLAVREIVMTPETEDMEDYLERKREEKLEIAQRHRTKVKNAENNLYF